MGGCAPKGSAPRLAGCRLPLQWRAWPRVQGRGAALRSLGYKSAHPWDRRMWPMPSRCPSQRPRRPVVGRLRGVASGLQRPAGHSPPLFNFYGRHLSNFYPRCSRPRHAVHSEGQERCVSTVIEKPREPFAPSFFAALQIIFTRLAPINSAGALAAAAGSSAGRRRRGLCASPLLSTLPPQPPPLLRHPPQHIPPVDPPPSSSPLPLVIPRRPSLRVRARRRGERRGGGCAAAGSGHGPRGLLWRGGGGREGEGRRAARGASTPPPLIRWGARRPRFPCFSFLFSFFHPSSVGVGALASSSPRAARGHCARWRAFFLCFVFFGPCRCGLARFRCFALYLHRRWCTHCTALLPLPAVPARSRASLPVEGRAGRGEGAVRQGAGRGG